jgi:hypothetical protein
MWSSKARLGKRKGQSQYSEDKIIWNIEIAGTVFERSLLRGHSPRLQRIA